MLPSFYPKILSEDQSVRSALFAVYSKATDDKCKCLSIPALKYSPKAIKKMITHMTDIVAVSITNSAQAIEIIRFVGKSMSTLKLFHDAL